MKTLTKHQSLNAGQSGTMDNLPQDTDQLQKLLKSSSRLIETTCKLASLHDLDEVLNTITSKVCDALDCERASLFLYNSDRNQLYTRMVTELEIEEIRLPIDAGIAGWVARRRKLANIPIPFSDARWDSSFDKKTGFKTRNILAVPLISIHEGRLLGVLQLMNKGNEQQFDEFDEQLVQCFAMHAASALERAILIDHIRKTHLMEIDIEMGRTIQGSFLPKSTPIVEGYELSTWWEPAEAVSGDYYDFIEFDDERLGIVMGDVSGHGIGPSLIMASVRAMVHVLQKTGSTPEVLLSMIAESIAPDLQEGRFITFLLGALDPEKHLFNYSNAGHGPALHYQCKTNTFHHLETTCPPMGFIVDLDIPEATPIKLEQGDLLILATDGVIELKNKNDEIFARDRLEALISKCHEESTETILSNVREAVNNFHPEEHPPDDISMIIVKRQN